MSSKRSPPSSSSPFGPPIPLAATSAWIGPSAPAARVIAFSTRRRCLTSHGSTRTGPSIDAAVASSRSRPRATSVSAAPSRARRRAIARPMPVPAPVTTTCFPFNQSPVVRNLRPFRRRIPLRGCVPERRLPLRRARDASRTKLSRKAVRGSGRSAGEVDESAPGSAKPWSCLGRAHGGQRKYVRIVKKNPQRAGIAVRARLTPAPRARSVLDCTEDGAPEVDGSPTGSRFGGGQSGSRTKEHRSRCISAWNGDAQPVDPWKFSA